MFHKTSSPGPLPWRTAGSLLATGALIAACGGVATDAAPAIDATVTTQTTLPAPPSNPMATTTTETTHAAEEPEREASIAPTQAGPDTPPTPIARLRRFRWEVASVVTDDRRQVVYVESNGYFDDGAFECDLTVRRLNRTAVLDLVGTRDGRAYLNRNEGRGLEIVERGETRDEDAPPTDEEIYDANLAFCPGAGPFWDDLGVDGELISSPNVVDRNDEVVRRVDLTAIPAIRGFLSPLGPPGQTTYDRFTVFVTEEGGWINAIEMSAKVSAEAVGELADREPGPTGRLDVRIDILDADDPEIEVDDPES